MTLLRNAEVGGRVVDIGFGARIGATPDDTVIDCRGGALLPGLHDHHLHLWAMAAARSSVDVRHGLDPLLSTPGRGWVRGVGAHGLTRSELDAAIPDRPVRVQHRSGHAWILNSAALRLLGLSAAEGVVVGDLPAFEDTYDLAPVGAELARYGITAVTDATPGANADDLGSSVPQRVSTLRKVIADAHAIPQAVEALRPGAVAIHCVTRAELVIALSVVQACDRIEHAAVVPAELIPRLPAVVTQPGFVADRGDDYRRDVEPGDLADLYRFRSLAEQGVPVVASSDAPYGPADPWQVIRAARDRIAPDGEVLGPDERVTAAVALDGYLRRHPWARRNVIASGFPADLVLLHVPLAEALANPTSEHVRATWIGGELRT